MKSKYNIQVTDKHIQNGVPKLSNSCPIALAIREAISNLEFIEVTGSDVELQEYDSYDYKTFITDEFIARWVSIFDGDDEEETVVTPFEFVINTKKGTASYVKNLD